MNKETHSTPEPIVSVPIQPTTTTYFTYKRLVELSESAPFPKNLFSFRGYNSWKVFALIVFAFALFNFGRAFIVPIAYPDRFIGQAQVQYDNRGVIKRGWQSFYGWAWQRTPVETKVIEIARKQIAWDRWCACIGAVMAWLFLWLCFDWRNARTMIYGIFLICFGILYTLSPIDLIPDIVPIFGFLDDAAMILFGGGLGLMSIVENAKMRKQDSSLREIMKENPSSAVNIILKDYGLSIEDVHVMRSNDV